jgi:RNA polymerase sigma factor (sigma-70 family)
MAVGQPSPLLRYIRRLACSAAGNGPTDGQLLERYVVDGHNAAFGVLVKRHGPMVHGVCRRILGNVHDADDALQAVFLVLMRSAHKIANTECIGSWLYGVAYRTALRAKRSAGRRRHAERNAPAAGFSEYESESVWTELRPVLDQEIARLPEKWRLPFVLCYLEGKTNTEAAHQLRWPLGTVATRLARARDRLRKRLTSRGAGLATGMLLAAETRTEFAAGACKRLGASQMDAVLEGASSKWAVSLAKGVVRAMWITKLRVAAMVLAAAGAVGGGAAMSFRTAVEADQGPQIRVALVPQAMPNGGQDAKPDAESAVKPGGDENPWLKAFTIECSITEVGPDGEETIQAAPQMYTTDGKQGQILIGQNYPLFAEKNGEVDTVEYRDLGLQLTIKPTSRKDGRIRLDCNLEIAAPAPTEGESALIRGVMAQYIKVAKSGDTIEFEVEKYGSEGGQYRIALTVHEHAYQEYPPSERKAPIIPPPSVGPKGY